MAVEYKEGMSHGIHVPVSPLTVAGAESIPIGSEVVLIDYRLNSNVRILNLTLEEDSKETLRQFADTLYEDERDDLVVAYVPPLTDEQATDIANKIMVDRGWGRYENFEDLTVRELRAMLVEAAHKGRMNPS